MWRRGVLALVVLTVTSVALASQGGGQSLAVYSRYDTEPSTGSRRIRGRFVSF